MIDLQTPLHRQIRNQQDLYGSLWTGKIAQILELIADVAETRGDKKLDLDPGETADWLRAEAQQAREGI